MLAASISGSSWRHLIGIGTPRGLQGRVAAVIATLLVLIGAILRRISAISASHRPFSPMRGWLTSLTTSLGKSSAAATYTTGC